MPKYKNRPVDLVIDVRSRVEFFFGHLDAAECIPTSRLLDELAGRSDVTHRSRILLYCASGARSADAAATLRAAGYKGVTDAGSMALAHQDYSAI